MSLRSLVTRHTRALRGSASACSSSSSSSSSSLRTFTTTAPRPYHGIERPDNDDEELIDLTEDLDESEVTDNGNELNTLGHLKLHRHRELLGYYRLAVHDFPNLEQFRQPYRPHDEREDLLTFRIVHFQGEAKAGTNKSTLTVDVSELFASKHFANASNAEKRKFLHLAGTHWIPGDTTQVQEEFKMDGKYSDVPPPSVGMIKISCARFPYESQNAKWCSDVLDSLLEHAKSKQGEEGNAIADLPLDLRAAQTKKAKKMHTGGVVRASIADWPKEWKTPRQQAGTGKQQESQSP